MINSTSTSGHVTYGIKEFVVDMETDVVDLPIECTIGSTALVLETSNVYVLSGSRKWVKI